MELNNYAPSPNSQLPTSLHPLSTLNSQLSTPNSQLLSILSQLSTLSSQLIFYVEFFALTWFTNGGIMN